MNAPLLLGLLACAGLAAAGLMPVPPRARMSALAAALLIAPILVVADNWGGERVAEVRDRPILLAVAILLVALGVLVLALLIRRRPAWLVPVLIAALPFRIPIDLGAGSANLLLPLYALIAAGVLARLLEARTAERPRAEPSAGLLRWSGPALGAFVVLYALQAAYADDGSAAVENVSFFLVPFAALFALLASAEWSREPLRAVLAVLVAEGLLFALVAGVQYALGDLFWNDKLIAGNEAHPYFRVNSLFYDPNILGRYLAVTMVALAGLVAFTRRRSTILAAGATFAVLAATLVVTFSQTSTIALLGGILVLTAARWGIGIGAGAAAAMALALLASLSLIGGGGLSGESSGRSGLIDGGLEIARDAPVLGVGSGGFAGEFADRFGSEEGFAVESHTEPVTVLAEQGAVGFAMYLTLLFVTIGGLIGAAGLSLRTRARGAPLAAVSLAIYAVMVVHSLGYAAFLTDPVTWAVLALALAASRTARPAIAP